MTEDTPATRDRALDLTLSELCEEGWEIWADFDRDVRSRQWHSFVPADYDRVRAALVALHRPGRRFLEWGSATGVIAIMADLLGYDACGIEIDGGLVDISRDLARRYGSNAQFAHGSILPTGYVWRPPDGDGRLGTLGMAPSGYLKLGRPLDDFDFVYGYPWTGEDAMMHDLMRAHGARGALFAIQRVSGDIDLFRDGKPVAWGSA